MRLDFRPTPCLPGPHLQTLGARLLRSRTGVRLARERLTTPDGDFLDLDWLTSVDTRSVPDNWPLVLVLHGLEGSARSGYMLEQYRALGRAGVAAVGLNFRSCSGELNRNVRLYHSGETGDLQWALDALAERHPNRRLGAAGFSLGGNVLLKYLGERGRAGAGLPVECAAVVSVPFQLAAGAEFVEHGFARAYRRYLVGRLKRKVRAKQSLLSGHIDVGRALGARTFRDFDEAATAPVHGFRGADDYYHRSSSARFLTDITVPTLIIHSRDDPFLPETAIPDESEVANPNLEWLVTDMGGHVGFVGGRPWRPRFWAEDKVARFLSGRLLE